MRLFVAINFNEDTRSRLLSLRDELRSKSQGGNFSLPENLHLTLAFIGEVSPKKIDKVKAVLDTVTFRRLTQLLSGSAHSLAVRSGGRVCKRISR